MTIHRGQPGIPYQTSINGEQAEWTPEIWKLWYTYVSDVDPKHVEVYIGTANYFEPRPYRNEWDRGSDTYGFVWSIGDKVYYKEWRQARG